MSGYLEVKYPSKSNLGLNPFKSWKRQWCILRPSSTTVGGGSLAVYCSEAGAPAGTVDLPADCVVRRTKSRTRPHAFAVYSVHEPRKPRILLAAQTLNDAQIWMEKIKNLLIGNKLLGTDKLLKDSYSVAVVTTEFSRKSGIHGDNTVTLFADGVYVSRSQKLHTIVEWRHISNIELHNDSSDKSTTCTLTINSKRKDGGGELKFFSPMASDLVTALKGLMKHNQTNTYKKLSKSDGDLHSPKRSDSDIGEVRRSSWYSGPSEVSLDDIDLVMSKEAKRIPSGQLARCSGAGHLADDSMSDRRSMASGIYEEIPERAASPGLYLRHGAHRPHAALSAKGDVILNMSNALSRQCGEEPAYESVAECVSRRARRPPPPLPPRLPLLPLPAAQVRARGLSDIYIRSNALSRQCGEEPAYESVAECVSRRARRPPPPLPPRLPLLPLPPLPPLRCVPRGLSDIYIRSNALSRQCGEEPAYESVAECVSRRARRPPPPLPPRLPLLPLPPLPPLRCVPAGSLTYI
ncbi:hypothetical protein ACJJTC_010348 [Scirpophaga incertulas]